MVPAPCLRCRVPHVPRPAPLPRNPSGGLRDFLPLSLVEDIVPRRRRDPASLATFAAFTRRGRGIRVRYGRAVRVQVVRANRAGRLWA